MEWTLETAALRLEEALTGLTTTASGSGLGAPEEVWRSATFVPRPGADDAEVTEAEAAWRRPGPSLTRTSPTCGSGRQSAGAFADGASDRVALFNKAEADLAARARGVLRELGAGRPPLEHRVGARRAEGVGGAACALCRRVAGREPLSRRCEVELR